MPNNRGMLKAPEIIALLGGPHAAGRFFGVKPPSVMGWIESGVIPEGRLLKRAGALERLHPGVFSRRDQWPGEFAEIWPEMAAAPAAAVGGATQVTAGEAAALPSAEAV
mgnify:CR=1 FL=1